MLATLFVSLVFAFSAHAETAFLNASRLTAPLEWTEDEPFHGSSLFFEADAQLIYFITNAHVIPKDFGVKGTLRLRHGMTDLVKTRAMVIGVAPGYDIAVVAVPRTSQYYGWADFYRRIFNQSLLHELPTGPQRVAIAGYPGAHWNGITEWTSLPWEDEMDLFSHWRPRHPGPIVSPLKSSDLSERAIPIEVLKQCPQTFLEFCYRLQVRTHGYSGGALWVGPNRKIDYRVEQPKIAGLVSHYSPLAGDTYVIPISIAVRVAKRLLATAKKGGLKTIAYETVDESGSAEWLADHSVRLLKGADAGKVFSTSSLTTGKAIAGGGPSTGGGGPSTGGGGPSTGGGGPSTGGGGETATHSPKTSSGTKFILASNWHSLGVVQREPFLEDLRTPESWGLIPNGFVQLLTIHPLFVGSYELLSFAPGLKTASGQFQYLNRKPLVHIQQVVAAARENQELSFSTAAPVDFPKTLSLRSPQTPGLIHLGAVHVAKPFSQLSALERQQTWSELPEVAQAAEEIGGAQGRAAALLSGSELVGNLAAGNLIRDAGEARLEMLSGRFGKMALVFPDRFDSTGDSFFQYRGKIQITEIPLLEKIRLPLRAEGVITVQRDFEHNRYEVKVVLATADIPRRTTVGLGTLWEQMLQPMHTFDGGWSLVLAFFLPFDGTEAVALVDNQTMAEREVAMYRHFEESERLRASGDPAYKIGNIRRGTSLRP